MRDGKGGEKLKRCHVHEHGILRILYSPNVAVLREPPTLQRMLTKTSEAFIKSTVVGWRVVCN
jgi:hypothetical protein